MTRMIAMTALVASFCLAAPVRSQSAMEQMQFGWRLSGMMSHAKGTFDVKVAPLVAYDSSAGSKLGRMSIDKVFHGDIEGTSKGEMLTGMTDIANSAGYVAIERVTGTVNGRKGSFVLQHTGTMNRGAQSLVITVVPDSGTDDLAGIAGTFTIRIADGKHYYDFDYTLKGVQ